MGLYKRGHGYRAANVDWTPSWDKNGVQLVRNILLIWKHWSEQTWKHWINTSLKHMVFQWPPELLGSGRPPGCSRKISVLLKLTQTVVFAWPASESLWGLIKMQDPRPCVRPTEQECIGWILDVIFHFRNSWLILSHLKFGESFAKSRRITYRNIMAWQK